MEVVVPPARLGSRAQCLFHLPQDTNARLPLPGAAGFAIRCLRVYPCLMPSKPIELPPEIARAFVRDMRAFFALNKKAPASTGAFKFLAQAGNQYLSITPPKR